MKDYRLYPITPDSDSQIRFIIMNDGYLIVGKLDYSIFSCFL